MVSKVPCPVCLLDRQCVQNANTRRRDADPTCMQELPKARAGKATQASQTSVQSDVRQRARSEFKAPTVPGMIPRPANTIPGFPTLEGLPNAVAETLQGAPSEATQSSHGDIIPYHSSRLPTRNNLDTLLTAVNVASRIDAPTPTQQGRNYGVIPYLDAQAASREHRHGSSYSWANTREPEHTYLADGPPHGRGYPAIAGLGISHADTGEEVPVPAKMVLPTQYQAINTPNSMMRANAGDNFESAQAEVTTENDGMYSRSTRCTQFCIPSG